MFYAFGALLGLLFLYAAARFPRLFISKWLLDQNWMVRFLVACLAMLLVVVCCFALFLLVGDLAVVGRGNGADELTSREKLFTGFVPVLPFAMLVAIANCRRLLRRDLLAADLAQSPSTIEDI